VISATPVTRQARSPMRVEIRPTSGMATAVDSAQDASTHEDAPNGTARPRAMEGNATEGAPRATKEGTSSAPKTAPTRTGVTGASTCALTRARPA